jgi:hypothetical protein
VLHAKRVEDSCCTRPTPFPAQICVPGFGLPLVFLHTRGRFRTCRWTSSSRPGLVLVISGLWRCVDFLPSCSISGLFPARGLVAAWFNFSVAPVLVALAHNFLLLLSSQVPSAAIRLPPGCRPIFLLRDARSTR